MYISDSTYFEYNVYLNNWFSNTLPPQEHLNLAPNQVILLADGQSKVQRFALTNHYGEFVFKNIPRQIIKLRPEKFGVAAQTFTVDLNQQQYIEFILNPGSIVIQVENNELQSERLRVFPNPTSSYVFVELDKILLEKEVIIELTSMQGISVYKECIRYNQGESLLLPLSELAAGVYILSVRNNNYFERCFIIKQ
ncbi:MAG: T9SS type A sorting domain-containing protein [Bacteroidales bacterium]|nr:T9SS type A sorting domain-containing protein [Bacteroidales bacterium]